MKQTPKIDKDSVFRIMAQVEQYTCQELGVTIFDLRKISMKRSSSALSEARHIVWYNLYHHHGIKSPKIQQYFNCSRNALLRGVKQIDFTIKNNYLKKRERLNNIINTVNGQIT
jgi:hypothetical protein